ncbi:Signal transduction histidine kinase [Desulfocicer vacuolatum DSM 3385]|uniref:histidine kinase n=1 Tax=Desulfocicer vacuolatum DSM 3385 TaxID=1121400 RepID=A0A1W2EDA9_9BACT|nr:PAS domain-containing sensor histidine kinase [Desulfocicer vacuolatum]SMD07699.1 Signal transduction histidine kinase [Desulfocicer vacuolatum DSM 3385]
MKSKRQNDPEKLFREEHFILLTGGIFLALIWIFSFLFISSSYKNEIKSTQKQIQNLSRVLGGSLDSSFANTEKVIKRLSNNFARNWNRYLFERYQAVNRLSAAVEGLPQLEKIVVLDNMGTVIFTNYTSRPLSKKYSRLPSFPLSVGPDKKQLLCFDILPGQKPDMDQEGWIRYPIALPGGMVVGSVAARLSAQHYNTVLAGAGNTPGIEIFLHTVTGHLFAGVRRTSTPVVPVDSNALTMGEDSFGTFLAYLKNNGDREKIFHQREISPTCLKLTVWMPVGSALKCWKENLFHHGSIFVLLNLLLFLAFGRLWRATKQQRMDKQRLFLSEKRFRGLFHNSIEGIAIYKAVDKGNDFVFIDINPAGEKISSVSVPEVMGRRITAVFPGVREMGLLEALQRVYRTGNHELLPAMHYEDDTRSQWMKNTVYSLSQTEVVVTFTDETELHRVEAQRHRLESQLRQSQRMEAVGTLAGGIAHDFNNILSSVLGYTELALYDVSQGDGPMENYLTEIQTAGNRARDLVRQILTFARQTDEDIGPLRPARVVKEVLKLLRSSVPTTIEIRHTVDDTAMILADSTQIYQVIMNLCTNATHAMDIRGGVLTVEVSQHRKDDIEELNGVPIDTDNIVRLMVGDTGVGMSPDVQTAVFEPYFTTKKPGEGTGLGLAVVHGIVKKHGGHIHVESKENVGSRFYLFFPEKIEAVPENPSPAFSIPGGTERILLVDDEPAILSVNRELLMKRGYSVKTSPCPDQALGFFKSAPHSFDLVITDMTMPGMTGDILARKMIEIRQDIPIILCTGYSNKITRERAQKLGIKGFVHKPVGNLRLARIIRTVLDGDSPI